MISPGNSPHLIRRSATPTTTAGVVVMPPPLPPRKSSPTLLEQAAAISQSESELSQIAKSNSVQDVCSSRETDNGG